MTVHVAGVMHERCVAFERPVHEGLTNGILRLICRTYLKHAGDDAAAPADVDTYLKHAGDDAAAPAAGLAEAAAVDQVVTAFLPAH